MQLIKRRLRHDIASRFLSDANKRFLYKYTKIVVVAGQKGKRAKLQIAINFVLKQQQQQRQLATILKVEESRNTKSGSCKGNASQAKPSRAEPSQVKWSFYSIYKFMTKMTNSLIFDRAACASETGICSSGRQASGSRGFALKRHLPCLGKGCSVCWIFGTLLGRHAPPSTAAPAKTNNAAA